MLGITRIMLLASLAYPLDSQVSGDPQSQGGWGGSFTHGPGGEIAIIVMSLLKNMKNKCGR